MNLRDRNGRLLPMSCCGSMSGHTHSCVLVSDRARKAADHEPAEPCAHCDRIKREAEADDSATFVHFDEEYLVTRVYPGGDAESGPANAVDLP